jgi:hypothetical protein
LNSQTLGLYVNVIYSVDQAFSLANPSIKGQDVPQPTIFDGILKSYQLKVVLPYGYLGMSIKTKGNN